MPREDDAPSDDVDAEVAAARTTQAKTMCREIDLRLLLRMSDILMSVSPIDA